MRDINRIPRILKKLEIIWGNSPNSADLRFNQLVYNLNPRNENAYNMEDFEFENILDDYIIGLNNKLREIN